MLQRVLRIPSLRRAGAVWSRTHVPALSSQNCKTLANYTKVLRVPQRNYRRSAALRLENRAAVLSMQPHEIYTDGACRGAKERRRGGIGVYFGEGDERNVSEPLYGTRHTNQRAELTALLRALQIVRHDARIYTVYSDSMYAVRGVNEWLDRWKQNGWRTAKGTYVANEDLWRSIDQLHCSQRVHVEHVRAHSGIEGNERADALAVRGAKLGAAYEATQI